MRLYHTSFKDKNTIMSIYELDCSCLNIKEFKLEEEWFKYISNNRYFKEDYLKEYDVIIGPISNDTIYNLYGVITSGYLTSSQSLQILKIGNEYTQVVLKSPKAIDDLKFISSNIISSQDIESNYRAY